jgi:hypothetical protein
MAEYSNPQPSDRAAEARFGLEGHGESVDTAQDCSVRDPMALPRAASKDENRGGVGCARSCLVRMNPCQRLTPGAFPAPRTVVLVHASQRR